MAWKGLSVLAAWQLRTCCDLVQDIQGKCLKESQLLLGTWVAWHPVNGMLWSVTHKHCMEESISTAFGLFYPHVMHDHNS